MADAARNQVRHDGSAGRDPLDHWRAQEIEPPLEDWEAPSGEMPGGWWLLPVMVMAVPVWSVILWLLLRG